MCNVIENVVFIITVYNSNCSNSARVQYNYSVIHFITQNNGSILLCMLYQLIPNSATYHNDGGLINITAMWHDRNDGRWHKKSINDVNDSIGCNNIFHFKRYSFFREQHSSLRAKEERTNQDVGIHICDMIYRHIQYHLYPIQDIFWAAFVILR